RFSRDWSSDVCSSDLDAYDRAELDATTYWSRVCADIGKDLDPKLLDSLVALDLNAWTYLNRHTLKTLTELADRGVPLALLSNAPDRKSVGQGTGADPV